MRPHFERGPARGSKIGTLRQNIYIALESTLIRAQEKDSGHLINCRANPNIRQ